MQSPAQGSTTYLRKLFIFNHGAGLLVGSCFPFVAYILLGEAALTPVFFLVCLFAGLCLGAASYWFVRQTLKNQLQQQLHALYGLIGEETRVRAGQTLEGLFVAVASTVAKVSELITRLQETIDEFVPHYQTLAAASRYLSARAEDGLQ